MQKIISFFASLLLCCSVQAHESDYSLSPEYLQVKAHLEQLKIKKREINTFREVLVILDFKPKYELKGTKISRTGRYQDQLLIEYGAVKLQIPEWCLLVYLDELEKEMRNKEIIV